MCVSSDMWFCCACSRVRRECHQLPCPLDAPLGSRFAEGSRCAARFVPNEVTFLTVYQPCRLPPLTRVPTLTGGVLGSLPLECWTVCIVTVYDAPLPVLLMLLWNTAWIAMTVAICDFCCSLSLCCSQERNALDNVLGLAVPQYLLDMRASVS